MATKPVSPLGRAGAYDLLLELASGGMATVFLGQAADQEKLVAVKRPHKHLASDKQFLTMLLDEARVASAIDHPNVVRVRELAFETGEPFIVLEYIEGCAVSDLRKELSAADRALPVKVALRIGIDALAGLHAAHELGIIHRDISPHNVLLSIDGVARVTDFGIAKAEDRLQVTRTHEVKGKLAYLAPERVDKRRVCTRQSDVFSMGVVLWECLAGRRLFRSEEAVDTLEEVLHGPIPRLRELGAHVPPALDDVLAKALARDLPARFPTAAAFAQALDQAAGGAVGSARDVAGLVEVVFGARLGLRHQQLRGVLGAERTARALRATGIAERPPLPQPLLPSPAALASVAPAAPSQRYAFGGLKHLPRRERRWLLPLVAGAGGGLALGTIAVGILSLPRGHEATAPTLPAASMERIAYEPPSVPSSAEPGGDAGEIELDPMGDPTTTRRARPTGFHPPPLGTVHNGFTKLR